MVKTFGSKDIVSYRKTRKDIGKKRKTYRGNPVVGRKKQKYKKKIGNKTGLWLRAFWRIPMTRDGYKNWKPHLRAKVYKEVTNMKMSPTFRNVPFELIDTKEKIEDFFANMLCRSGKFAIMGGGTGKTKTGFCPKHICTIVVRETPEGYIGNMSQNKRLSKYKWFYKG